MPPQGRAQALDAQEFEAELLESGPLEAGRRPSQKEPPITD